MPTPRRAGPSVDVARVLLVALALLLPCTSTRADRGDVEAADLYVKGCKAIRKGDYREGIRLIEEAVGRGATEPNDQQGDSRFPVTRYDPYYWLGIAHMGLGDDEKALINFQKSKNFGVIKTWKKEWKDLNTRLDAVRRRLEIAGTQPAPIPPPNPMPSPTAIVVAVLPAPTPSGSTFAPTPTARAATPAGPAPRPITEASAAVIELRRLGDELDRWLATSALDAEIQRHLTSRRDAVRNALSNSRLSSQALSKVADAEKKRYGDSLLPALRDATLAAALTALQRKDWEACDAALTAARRTGAFPAIDVVDLVRHTTRYLLTGRRDPGELEAAKAAFRSWRAKVGPNRPLPPFVSPAIRALLSEGQNR